MADYTDDVPSKGEERYENGPGVQSDDKPVEDPIDAETADSDQQLGKSTQLLEDISIADISFSGWNVKADWC